MCPETDITLRQGGKVLKVKQQLDNLFNHIQEQQGEKEQQVQQVFYTGSTYLQSLQKIEELQGLLEQLKTQFTSEGKGISGLPYTHIKELAADLGQGLQREAGVARQGLQKSLQQAALSLLQGLEVGREINKLDQLQQISGQCNNKLQELARGHSYPSIKGRGNGVASDCEQ